MTTTVHILTAAAVAVHIVYYYIKCIYIHIVFTERTKSIENKRCVSALGLHTIMRHLNSILLLLFRLVKIIRYGCYDEGLGLQCVVYGVTEKKTHVLEYIYIFVCRPQVFGM